MQTLPLIKKISFSLALILSFLITPNLNAQEGGEGPYVSVACFEIESSQALVGVVKDMWHPFMTHLKKNGKILDWMLYEIVSPTGDDCPCDYREVIVFPNAKSMELFLFQDGGMMEEAMKAFPDVDLRTMGERFEKNIKFRSSSTYSFVDAALNAPPGNSDFIVANYMTVSESNMMDYVKMEREVFKPMHQERVKSGELIDWVLFQRVMPYGSDFEGNFVTIDNYGSLEKALEAMDMNWDSSEPSAEVMSVFNKMDKLRELSRAEFMKLAYKID